MLIQDSPAALRHWHPVLLSSKLKRKPLAVKILDQPLVVFRTPNGVAALDDRCPHRGARLSAGHVEQGCVVCPYHLWRFGKDGSGESPVNPRMKPFAKAFEATESLGFVWVRSKGSASALPTLDTQGLDLLGYHTGEIAAAFPIVVDNFTEIEHSPTNHKLLAFDAGGILHVEPQFEQIDNSLHVTYRGPQRKVPWSVEQVMGWKRHTELTIDFRVHFDPLRWVYDFSWIDKRNGQRVPMNMRELAIITPRSSSSTGVFLLFYISHPLFRRRNPLHLLARPIFLQHARREFVLDKLICENVASMGGGESLRGMQLGKFDRVLAHTRQLIASTYLSHHLLPENSAAAVT
jgi:phenylpropionate dioxygenase-like ring-hydroxylating dioxygenase large terminal subunit